MVPTCFLSHACIYGLWFLTDCFIKSGDDREAIIPNFSISGLIWIYFLVMTFGFGDINVVGIGTHKPLR